MTKQFNKYLKTSLAVVALATLSFIAWGKIQRRVDRSSLKTIAPDTVSMQFNYDPEVLEKFRTVCSKVTVGADEYYLDGSIRTLDQADSTAEESESVYILNKKGQYMYCKLGETETINSPGVYIYVDHPLKKIVISEEKKITTSAGLPDPSLLVKNMKEEGYQLLSQRSGQLESISLINDFHISCKLYQITFDAERLEPKQIKIRLSDALNPEDKGKDKVLEINIKSCSQHANKDLQMVKEIVEKKGSSWVAAAGYEDYQLVVI